MTHKTSLIVATTRNGVIGKNNELPWRLQNDMQFFRKTTTGKPIIMGRKTFESIGKPLPGRLNIVLTRQSDYSHDGIEVAKNLSEAIAIGRIHPEYKGKEIIIIGGAEIYKQALPIVDRMYVTVVLDRNIEGDAFFMEDQNINDWYHDSIPGWEVATQSYHPDDVNNEYEHYIRSYDRKIL